VARAMWKGAIQFGLVTIPVKLYLATESKYGVSFNMLHEKDLSRIQMKIFCPVDEEVIPRSETVKGYEWAPDQYVVITDEDLEKVPLKTMRSIEIEQFTKPDQEDGNVRFVKQAYYVEPDKIGRKAFYLLKQVLQDEELTAICKVVIKDREALAALDPFNKTMLLTTLHWPDEIRSIKELELPDEEFAYKPAELQMAKQLVAAMTGEFEPQNYKDEYREALMKVIDAKVEGKQIVEPAPVEESGKDAKKARAERPAAAAADKAKTGKKPAAARSARGKDVEEEARPARRRKSA
jgi:DNA end-binding protein Ku